MDENDLDILRAQAERNFRRCGRGLSKGPVTAVAIACGILPMLVVIPVGLWFQSPRLPFMPFIAPIILDIGVPFSTALAIAFGWRWVAPSQRRYPVIVATLIASLLRLSIFANSVIGEPGAKQFHWMFWHLLETASIAAVVFMALWVANGMLPPSARRRSSSRDIADHVRRAPERGGRAVGYRRSSSSPRRRRRLALGGSP